MIIKDQAINLRMMLRQKSQDHELPNSIAITSGKGGVGKTNVTTNLALTIALRKKRVCVLDADLGLSNIDVLLKLNPRYNLEHVISGEKQLSEILVKGPAGLTIIPASSGRASMSNMSDTDRAILMNELSQIAKNFDVLLIDTAAGISNNVTDFLLAATEVIVITTPEPTAITDAYALIKVLSQRKTSSIGIIINMTKSLNQAKEVADRIIMAVNKFLNANVHFLGHILNDDSVGQAVASQQPFVLKFPGSSATLCINQLADKILEKLHN